MVTTVIMGFTSAEILELHEEETGIPGGFWDAQWFQLMHRRRVARKRWYETWVAKGVNLWKAREWSKKRFARWIAKPENKARKLKYMREYDRTPERMEKKRLMCAKRRARLKQCSQSASSCST